MRVLSAKMTDNNYGGSNGSPGVDDFRRRSSAIVNIFIRLDSKTGFVKMLMNI